MQPGRTHFLFQSDQGTIDAQTWRLHAAWMVAALIVGTVVWRLLAPFTHHDLAKTAFIAPMTILAFSYLIIFAFAVLLIAISFYNLSAKRLRAAGWPTGLAGAVPFLALLSGAAHFIQPQVPDVIAIWYVIGIDLALACAVCWTGVVLGLRERAGLGQKPD